jgi:hypothetical protein
MKRTLSLSTTVVFGLLASVVSSHAVSTWDGGASTTDWFTANNWAPNSLPDGGDNTTLDGGGTGVTVLGGTFTGGDVQVNNLTLRNGHILTIDNSGFELFVDSGSAINMGQGGDTTDGSTINLIAGTLRGTGTLTMSNNTDDYGTSFFNLSGTGILNFGTLSVGSAAAATFSVTGSSATATLSGAVNAYAQSTFSFILDDTGVSSINAGGTMTIVSGAELLIDGSSYTGGAGTISLFSYASLADETEFIETITGFGSLTADIVYTDTGIDLVLVPEPSTFALFGGLFVFASVVLRRRR